MFIFGLIAREALRNAAADVKSLILRHVLGSQITYIPKYISHEIRLGGRSTSLVRLFTKYLPTYTYIYIIYVHSIIAHPFSSLNTVNIYTNKIYIRINVCLQKFLTHFDRTKCRMLNYIYSSLDTEE